MPDSQSPKKAPPVATSENSTREQQQMTAKLKIQNGNGTGADFAEEYFSTLSAPAKRIIEDVVAVRDAYEDVWNGFDPVEQEQIIDETIIRPDAVLHYEGRLNSADSKHPSTRTAEVRLSSFGVDKVFPRLQVQSGQKEASFEDTTGSQGEDLGSDCTYSYRDEHSGPFSWMTRSQQELSFESGPIEYIDGVEELDVLTASPSRVLNRQSLLIRQSKGNPIYSKPVGIPIVPTIEKKVERKSSDKMAAAPVSPHKINNFVYEEDNRIVLDFGPSSTSDAEKSGGAAEGNNKAATKENGNNFLDRVKNTKNTLKKSLSNVSHGGTLRRRKSQSKSQKSSPTHSPASTLSASFRLNPPTGSGTSGYSPTSTMSSSFASASLPRQHSQSSTMSIKQLGNHSPTSTISSRSGHVSITKPTMAPPPPPPNVNKPTAAPPPPPPQSHQMSKSLYVPSTSSSTSGTNTSATRSQEPKEPLASYEKEPKAAEVQPRKEADDVVKPLEEFKIDLNTGSDIPKTGFDFLDNW